MRRNVFAKVGRPPAMAAAMGRKMPGMGMKPAGLGLGAMPGGGMSPMQGMQTAVPAASFSRGGSAGYAKLPRYHDDAGMMPTASENGFSSHDKHFAKMCRGGRM